MYRLYGKDQEITLWREGRQDPPEQPVNPAPVTSVGRKRTSPDTTRPASKRQAIEEEVNEIFAKLKEKQSGSDYTAAQYRLWANMIQVGTHRDYDNPPRAPMFGFNSKSSKSTGSSLSEAVSSVAEGFMRALKTPVGSSSPRSSSPTPNSRITFNAMGVSPNKCASLRTQ